MYYITTIVASQEEYDQRNKEEDKKRQEIAAKFQVNCLCYFTVLVIIDIVFDENAIIKDFNSILC